MAEPPEVFEDPVPAHLNDRFAALRLDADATLLAFSNRSARWSPDRRWVAFLSNRDGTWKAYRSHWRSLSLPPRPVAGPPLPIADVSFSPTGSLWLHAQDQGLFTVDPETNTVASAGPSDLRASSAPRRAAIARDAIVTAAAEPKRLLFGTTSEPFQSTVPLSHEESPCAVHPSGDRVLAIERGETPTARILEIGRDGSRSIRFDGLGELRVDAATYTPSGDSILFAGTNQDGQTSVLRIGKSNTNRVPVFTTEPGTRVVELASSARSSTVAALTSSNTGMQVLLLHPHRLLPVRTLSLPPGIGSLGEFSRDGRSLTLTWETPSSPPDIYQATTDGASLRKLRDDVRPALARLHSLRATVVSLHDGPASHAIVFEPGDGSAIRGVLVELGLGSAAVPRWRPEVRCLVGLGYVVVAPLHPGESAEEVSAWLDVVDRWLSSQAWWRPGLRAVLGHAPRPIPENSTGTPWPAIVSAKDADFEIPRASAAWDVMVVWEGATLPQPSATRLMQRLRAAGAHAELASPTDASTRLARTALFLDRVSQSRAEDPKDTHRAETKDGKRQ